MTVYLLHFERKLAHAQHYVGYTTSLKKRLETHRRATRNDGRHHNLVVVMREQGIGFLLARTWKGGRALEKTIKAKKCAPRLCPICRDLPVEELERLELGEDANTNRKRNSEAAGAITPTAEEYDYEEVPF